jgi:hypothetical protein
VKAPAARREISTEPITSSATTPHGAAARAHVIVIERRFRSENAAEDPTDAMGDSVTDVSRIDQVGLEMGAAVAAVRGRKPGAD